MASHEAWACTAGDGTKTVVLANDQDGYSNSEHFKSHDELNAFIRTLRPAAEEAWGPDFSDPRYDE